eukprot:scaffold143621_cov36-Cyclotella_meneghiniana.AAC.2
MYFKASAVKVVLASPPTGHRASITSKKSAKDKVLGLIQGCEGQSKTHAKSSMSVEKSNHMTETMAVVGVGGLGDYVSSNKEEASAAEAEGGREGGVGERNYMTETMAVMGVGGFGDSESSNKEEALASGVEVDVGGGVRKRNHMTETKPVMGAGGFGDSESSYKVEAIAAEAEGGWEGGVGERNHMTETMAVMGVGGFGDSESSNKEEALAAEEEGGVRERNHMTETMAVMGVGGFGDSESSYKEEALAAEGGVRERNHMTETMPVMGVGGSGDYESSYKEEALAAEVGGGVQKRNHMTETMPVMGVGGFGDYKSSYKDEALAAEGEVEGLKVVLASPPAGHRASITAKKSAKYKVLGLVQGCEGHSNTHAKSSMSVEKSNHMTETVAVMGVGGLGDSESSNKEEALAAAAAEGGEGLGERTHMTETMAAIGVGGFGDYESSYKEESLTSEGGVGKHNYFTETMPVIGVGGFGDYESSYKEEALAAEVGGGVGERNHMTETMALMRLAFDIGDAGLLGRSMSFSNKKVVDNSGGKNVSWLDMGTNGTMISAYSNRPVVPIAMPPKDCNDMTKTEHMTLNGVIANAVHDSFGAGLHINSNLSIDKTEIIRGSEESLPRKEMENTVDGGRDLNMNYSNHMVGKSSIGLTAMSVLGSENDARVCTKLVNSSIRLKKKKNLAPRPWKRLFNVFLLCQFFSFIYASASVDQQTGKLGFSLDKDIRKLRGIDNSENTVGVIESVKKFILSLSNGLEPIQHHYKEGEFEEAGKSLKAIVGNMDSVARSLKDTKHVQFKEKYLPELFTKENEFSSDNGIISLKDIPNSMLGEQIHSEVFNQIVDFSKKLFNTLEDIDLPLLDDVSSKKKTSHVNSNFRHHKSKPNTKNKQQSAFDEFNSGNFMKIPTAQSIRKQVKVKGRGISLPKISTFVSVRDYNTVMSKHQLREEKMDVCSSECEVSNITCGCSKLFDCVQKLNEYDLAVLSAGGFIDDTAGSDNYGKFTVQTDELNLFNWDQDISKALQDVKDLVEESNPGDKEQCIAVLEKFHTACDPNSESCSKSNPHTFQGRKLTFHLLLPSTLI